MASVEVRVAAVKHGVAARLRTEYESAGLVEAEMAADPFEEFEAWFEGVIESELEQPNAFVLATADSAGRPSARAVLMKDFAADGIVFYTNLASRKSMEMGENPVAAATFVWAPLHRQVRFEGPVELVDPSEADEYFATRPRGAQIAAHASDQSRVVESREALEQRFTDIAEGFEGSEIPRPDLWGGWRLRPVTVEFWQGRQDRFHDRVLYTLRDGTWEKERLAP